MIRFRKTPLAASLVLASLTACVPPSTHGGSEKIGRDTYRVSGTAGNMGSAKAAAYKSAKKLADKQDKFVLFVNSHETSTPSLLYWSGVQCEYELVFRIVAEDDPEYQRVTMERQPDKIIEKIIKKD